MPPPFGTGSPSSTTRGLYSLLEKGPEQCASTTQHAATRPTWAIPLKRRPETCRPIRPPVPPPSAAASPALPERPQPRRRTDCARLVGRNVPCGRHIAVGSRQDWGCFVPSFGKQACVAYGTIEAPPRESCQQW